MQNEFWIAKWQANEIGFHLPDVHPLLKKYYPKFFSDAKKIFVPLCGKTHDMSFFADKGKKVLGVELSEQAAQSFFEQSSSKTQSENVVTQKPPFKSYHNSSIEILIGDFFELQASHLQKFNHLYDRAALIALPEKLRQRYVQHLRSILPSASMLLITLDYNQSQMKGPPFSVEQGEVQKLFSFAKIEQLRREDIIEQEPKFKSRGLSHFFETAYSISW